MRVLVVEDDDRVAAALMTVLTHHGFAVTRAATGGEALAMAASVDIVLLDIGLPDVDGFEVCTRLRRVSDVPIIAVTALSEQDARLHALNSGVDDYLVKPYDLRELVARIHAVTRRASRAGASEPVDRRGDESAVVVGPLRVEPLARTVDIDGERVRLTLKEFDLLALLATRPGVVFRREQILSAVWSSTSAGDGRTLEVHVASLRSKLGVPGLLETVRGIGYRLGG